MIVFTNFATAHFFLISRFIASLRRRLISSTPLHTSEVPTVARFPAWPGWEASCRKGPNTSNATCMRTSIKQKKPQKSFNPTMAVGYRASQLAPFSTVLTEREGFEPSRQLPAYALSKRTHSAAMRPLLI